MNDDIKKAKALQKEYIKAVAAKETKDDMLTWLLKKKKAGQDLKGFGMAKRKRKKSFKGADIPLWQAGAGALLMFGVPVAVLYYLTKD